MKTFDFLLQNNDEEIITNGMLLVEEMIFSEILNIDAITKWAEIDNATKGNRAIEFIPYERTNVPEMIVDDLNFEKAVKKKSWENDGIIFLWNGIKNIWKMGYAKRTVIIQSWKNENIKNGRAKALSIGGISYGSN